MNQLDVFYRAYELYKKEFVNNRDDYLFKKGTNSKKAPNDFVSMEEIRCEIEEDWIAAIEKGLHYITKAIKEDRQFIRNEGEVLPIEKIRRVSKDSIQDLSKHSNYITRLPEEGENVIPEKLLMIKRESDYTVYENRVVYTTLQYLKDFVAERLEKIKDLVNKYDGKVRIKKKIELGYRTVDVDFLIHDIRKNDELTIAKYRNSDKIKRLDNILNSVLILLKTPLMQEVSKAPLVTRPVTKTNVLKMNTNFKETLFVFDYVCAYNKPGYTVTETTKTIAPLSEEQENSFTDIILLSSFLSYEFNNAIEEDLRKSYLEEEKRRQTLRDDEVLKHIQELMAKAKKSDKAIGEYLLALEEGYHILEKRVEEAKEELENKIAEYEERIEEINKAHQKEIEDLIEDHEQELFEVRKDCAEQINDVIIKQQEALEEAKKEIAAKYVSTIESKDLEIINKKEEATMAKREIEELKQDNATLSTAVDKAKEECDKKIKEIEEELELAQAENMALRAAKGKMSANPKDFTSKERFDELEHELEVLQKFFDRAWKYTKKEIKAKHYKEIRKKGGE
ncbi:MAG: DUF2357 domain-containing protein [Bacilli bacterium]|nr:DUF2357 domain-containing protein [Bacilli bacterium]